MTYLQGKLHVKKISKQNTTYYNQNTTRTPGGVNRPTLVTVVFPFLPSFHDWLLGGDKTQEGDRDTCESVFFSSGIFRFVFLLLRTYVRPYVLYVHKRIRT